MKKKEYPTMGKDSVNTQSSVNALTLLRNQVIVVLNVAVIAEVSDLSLFTPYSLENQQGAEVVELTQWSVKSMEGCSFCLLLNGQGEERSK